MTRPKTRTKQARAASPLLLIALVGLGTTLPVRAEESAAKSTSSGAASNPIDTPLHAPSAETYAENTPESERIWQQLIQQQLGAPNGAAPAAAGNPTNPGSATDPLFEFPAQPYSRGLKMGGNIATHGVVEDVFVRAGVAALPQPEVGRELIEQSQLAEGIGRNAHALKLARMAQRHLPGNAELDRKVKQLEEQVAHDRKHGTTRARIQARLAKAIQYSDELIAAQRTDEALDLLQGVIDSMNFVENPDDLAYYRDAAKERLAQHATSALPPRPLASLQGQAGATPAGNQTMPAPARTGTMDERLQQPMTVDHAGTMFAVVLDKISQQTGVPIELDPILLAAQATPRHWIRLSKTAEPAGAVLIAACNQAGVVAIRQVTQGMDPSKNGSEEGLLITTPYRAEKVFRLAPFEPKAPTSENRPAGVGGGNSPQAGKNRTVPVHLQSGSNLVKEVRSLSE